MKYYLMAARPKTLPASLGPVLLATSIAVFEGSSFNGIVFVVTILCALLLQVSSNYINDYYDFKTGVDSDNRLGPKRVTAQGLLMPGQVKKAFLTTLLVSFLLGIYLMYVGGLPIIIVGLSSILFAYLYTGGPLPLSHIYLGEVLAFIFFGPVAVCGAYYLQAGDVSNTAIIAGFSLGFISSALMSINNLRDLETDRKTSKRTIAIALGEKKARLLTLAFVLGSLILPLSRIGQNYGFLLCFLPFFIFRGSWISIATDKVDEMFNDHLANCGKYLFVFSIISSLVFLYETFN